MQSETSRHQIQHEPAQNDSGHEIHLLDLLIVLSQRKRFIFWFTCAASLVTAVTVLLIPSRYTAETVILPPGQNSSMSSALLSQLGGSSALASAAGAGLGIENPGDMYVSLFRGRTVEEAVI